MTIKYVGFKVRNEAHFRKMYAKLVEMGFSESHSRNATYLLSLGSSECLTQTAVAVDRYGDILSVYKLNDRIPNILLVKPSQAHLFKEVAENVIDDYIKR